MVNQQKSHISLNLPRYEINVICAIIRIFITLHEKEGHKFYSAKELLPMIDEDVVFHPFIITEQHLELILQTLNGRILHEDIYDPEVKDSQYSFRKYTLSGAIINSSHKSIYLKEEWR